MSKRYKISREAQDEYSFKSQQRTFAAQEAGRFNDEIIATTVTKRFDDKRPAQRRGNKSPSIATSAIGLEPRSRDWPPFRR